MKQGHIRTSGRQQHDRIGIARGQGIVDHPPVGPMGEDVRADPDRVAPLAKLDVDAE